MKIEDGRKFITVRGTGNAFYDFDAKDFAEAVESVTQAPGRIPNAFVGGVLSDDQQPPVEDSLAKARRLRAMYGASSTTDAYETAIRERDEKLSQSMTVEELKKWMDVWNGDGNLFNIICDKIKERNEARAKISAP